MIRETDSKLWSRGFFFHGKIEVWQYRRGFRFAIDAPVLASFLQQRAGPALEVGTGCGIVSLIAAFRKTFGRILALEIQPELAALADFNVRKNSFSALIEVREGDFRSWKSPGKFAAIFANPPYYPPGRGRIPADRQKRIARFEETLTLEQLLEKSAGLLSPDGELSLILPAFREEEALRYAAPVGLYPARKRLVKPFAGAANERVLLGFSLAEGKICSLEPLVVFARDRVYTEELEGILAGDY